MNDITLLYYTANRISEFFSTRITEHLCSFQLPIVSVSQRPMKLGQNICVGDIGVSYYNTYKQILIGAEAAKTPYVACCEDDSLYTQEHFEHRAQVFAYNMNRWNVSPGVYYFRLRIGMFACIAPRELLIETLRLRFEKFPVLLPNDQLTGWAEPGRKEAKLGLPPVEFTRFETKIPILTFNHRDSTGGARGIFSKDVLETHLPHWGNAKTLWRTYYG